MIIQDNFGKSHNLINQPIVLQYNERVKRGFKAFGLNFLFAMMSVFIPVLHFFLVPLFLFLSVYQGIAKFKQTRRLDLNDEVCPVCMKSLGSGMGFMEGDILRTVCKACRSKLVIRD
jgi:hypothetical protein